MHHYNFPPYSVGETGFMRGPKRRDIGHGALRSGRSRRSSPPRRSSLHDPHRLRDARVERLVVDGIGVRLDARPDGRGRADQGAGERHRDGPVKEGDDYVILTDIQGAEDHLGDMDFKVAGSRDGITALQMDIKITGVTQQIMRDALEQAKRARDFILDRMLEVIPESRPELAANAPRITSVKINPEQIGLVIGKGGETIRGLESDYEVQIDIEEDGTILIYATDGEKAATAISAIQALTKEPEVGTPTPARS